MSGTIDRRKMLKSGLLMAGALPVLPGFLNSLSAAPRRLNICYTDDFSTDESAILSAPPELKARLFANENPFGPSPKAKKAVEEAMALSYQYAFMPMRELSQKIAEHEGLQQNNIMMASGSSPLLFAAAIHFSQKPGSNIITGDPSYDDLPSKATRLNTKWIKVPLTSEYKLDLDAMEKAIDANTSLVYICNPNNPTGTVVDTQKLKSFCERVSQKVTVFIDEAYIDYLDDPKAASMLDLVKAGKNIIVARTFSKLYGFAGLRVGYIAAQPDMLRNNLNKYAEGMMMLSNTSIHAALVSYQDKEYLQDALAKTNASKAYLYDVLKKEGYDYIKSSANFVLFPLKMDAEKFVNEMNKRGVGVRSWNFNEKNWCRVSIGRMDEMQAFAAAFKELS